MHEICVKGLYWCVKKIKIGRFNNHVSKTIKLFLFLANSSLEGHDFLEIKWKLRPWRSEITAGNCRKVDASQEVNRRPSRIHLEITMAACPDRSIALRCFGWGWGCWMFQVKALLPILNLLKLRRSFDEPGQQSCGEHRASIWPCQNLQIRRGRCLFGSSPLWTFLGRALWRILVPSIVDHGLERPHVGLEVIQKESAVMNCLAWLLQISIHNCTSTFGEPEAGFPMKTSSRYDVKDLQYFLLG